MGYGIRECIGFLSLLLGDFLQQAGCCWSPFYFVGALCFTLFGLGLRSHLKGLFAFMLVMRLSGTRDDIIGVYKGQPKGHFVRRESK